MLGLILIQGPKGPTSGQKQVLMPNPGTVFGVGNFFKLYLLALKLIDFGRIPGQSQEDLWSAILACMIVVFARQHIRNSGVSVLDHHFLFMVAFVFTF